MVAEGKNVLHVLLAEDDIDERLFFTKALKELTIGTRLEIVADGERLLEYLHKWHKHLPDILFLDINMPCKNGAECLKEIKADKELQKLPVIIFSTSLTDEAANQYYRDGAHYYIKKPEIQLLKKFLGGVLTKLAAERFNRPSREEFIVNFS